MSTVLTAWNVPEQRREEITTSPQRTIEDRAADVGLRVRATGVWPGADGTDLPGVAGFIVSSFNPLVVEAARRALTVPEGTPPVLTPDEARTTAVILISGYGDVTSAHAVARAVDAGTRVGPLLFFQSVPNAVAGYVATRWGLAGPVLAISPAGDPWTIGLEAADLLIDDGDADRALLIFVEQGSAEPTGAEQGSAGTADAGPDRGEPTGVNADRAFAVLVERAKELGT